MGEVYNTPIAEQITVKEVQSRPYFSVKNLKKILENLDDDMLVTIQRVEDAYFKNYNHSWKTVKSLLEVSKIGENTEKTISEWIYDSGQCDPSLYELGIDEKGNRVFKSYIDTVPVHTAYVSKEKTPNGENILVLTHHY